MFSSVKRGMQREYFESSLLIHSFLAMEFPTIKPLNPEGIALNCSIVICLISEGLADSFHLDCSSIIFKLFLFNERLSCREEYNWKWMKPQDRNTLHSSSLYLRWRSIFSACTPYLLSFGFPSHATCSQGSVSDNCGANGFKGQLSSMSEASEFYSLHVFTLSDGASRGAFI